MFNKNISNIYIYLRVSTKNQESDSNGLENQKKICEQYIKDHFGKINSFNIEYYTDIASSYNKPDALKKLNKLLKNILSESIIIVGDVSRLGRNCFQVFTMLRKIKKSNCKIIAVSDGLIYNNSNKLMDKKFYNKIIEAEQSSDLKSIKSSERIQFIKKHNGYLGKAFYGTKILKINNIPRLHKNNEEIKNINLMKSQYKILKEFDMVADYMNLNNKLNRKGKIWNEKTIRQVLTKFYPNILSNPNTNVINKQIINLPDISGISEDNVTLSNLNNMTL